MVFPQMACTDGESNPTPPSKYRNILHILSAGVYHSLPPVLEQLQVCLSRAARLLSRSTGGLLQPSHQQGTHTALWIYTSLHHNSPVPPVRRTKLKCARGSSAPFIPLPREKSASTTTGGSEMIYLPQLEVVCLLVLSAPPFAEVRLCTVERKLPKPVAQPHRKNLKWRYHKQGSCATIKEREDEPRCLNLSLHCCASLASSSSHPPPHQFSPTKAGRRMKKPDAAGSFLSGEQDASHSGGQSETRVGWEWGGWCVQMQRDEQAQCWGAYRAWMGKIAGWREHIGVAALARHVHVACTIAYVLSEWDTGAQHWCTRARQGERWEREREGACWHALHAQSLSIQMESVE
ncbi:hypothetical protein B0H19DRAFT_1081242 [Mycena capillaripes]|nr:hypothetical protein B0H19DRAFT_1081242 [Mycena capillaripes]